MLQRKQNFFGNYVNHFSLKIFIINKNLLLKLKEVYHQVKYQLQIFKIIIL